MYLKELTDISAVRDLPELSTLVLHSIKIESLPAEFATLSALRKMTIDDLGSLSNLEVLGDLSSLVELKLEDLEKIVALPASMGKLQHLRRIELDDMEAPHGFMTTLTSSLQTCATSRSRRPMRARRTTATVPILNSLMRSHPSFGRSSWTTTHTQ